MTEPGWDCDYPTWTASFSQAVPTAPFQVGPATTGAAHEMPSGSRVERRGDLWVVRDDGGSYWCGLIENGWTASPDDEEMAALTFPTEAEARSAYIQADRMYGERAARHQAAAERLGLIE